jgi:hypothetical protein
MLQANRKEDKMYGWHAGGSKGSWYAGRRTKYWLAGRGKRTGMQEGR